MKIFRASLNLYWVPALRIMLHAEQSHVIHHWAGYNIIHVHVPQKFSMHHNSAYFHVIKHMLISLRDEICADPNICVLVGLDVYFRCMAKCLIVWSFALSAFHPAWNGTHIAIVNLPNLLEGTRWQIVRMVHINFMLSYKLNT